VALDRQPAACASGAAGELELRATGRRLHLRAGEYRMTRLETTPLAIHSRFQRVMAKMGVRSRRRAAQLAAEYGLI
jgi:hypothetical protein